MNFFYSQSATFKNLLSSISKQFVQEVNCTHYIYGHCDSCGMLLILQLHGKKQEAHD